MPIRKAVTLKTIAQSAGVTVQTVIKALKGKPGMSEATRRAIIQTAVRLGYYTMDQIRSLRLEHIEPYPAERLRFVVVYTDESAVYIRKLVEGLHERFASFGHQIEEWLLPSQLPENRMAEWVEESGLEYADGVFIAPAMTPRVWESHLFRLQKPRILLNYPPPGVKIDSVIWDIYEAVYESVLHLMALGHKRILYVGDIHSQRGYILRWQAFCQAMDSEGLDTDAAHHCLAEFTVTGEWERELRDRLERYRPTACICGLHHVVPDVWRILQERKLLVPQDVSLVGLLNEQPEELPLFTRPLLPIRETGYRAADRMLWRLANPTLPYEHIRIQGELFLGTTAGPPPIEQEEVHPGR
ncbi:LacI family DNA-binding transcriptional regulator [Gorillibacterium sp. sgz5001074]|uniref:LacI family DNA-binding transcriptional regulator n=1 Tax=Gorillibacterium sp. sgz5001074 TaxID=3446695 RepID=UPI003F67FF21